MWSIVKSNGIYCLNNSTRTTIRKHKQVEFSFVEDVISKLNEINFPLKYSEGIKEIYFTYLKSYLEGDYCEGHIRIACNNAYKHKIYLTLVHEIGHHIDFKEGIYKNKKIVEEWNKKKNSFVHINIDKEPSEYVAIGFEKFYCNKKYLQKHHLALYNVIKNTEKKYK